MFYLNDLKFNFEFKEHVIHVWFDTNAIFHNGLIHEYREKVEHLLLRKNASSTENQSGQHIRTKLLKFLEQSTHYTAESVITKFPYNSKFLSEKKNPHTKVFLRWDILSRRRSVETIPYGVVNIF